MMHAQIVWKLDEMVVKDIKYTKIDISLDLAGSFLPKNAPDAFDKIKTRLQ